MSTPTGFKISYNYANTNWTNYNSGFGTDMYIINQPVFYHGYYLNSTNAPNCGLICNTPLESGIYGSSISGFENAKFWAKFKKPISSSEPRKAKLKGDYLHDDAILIKTSSGIVAAQIPASIDLTDWNYYEILQNNGKLVGIDINGSNIYTGPAISSGFDVEYIIIGCIDGDDSCDGYTPIILDYISQYFGTNSIYSTVTSTSTDFYTQASGYSSYWNTVPVSITNTSTGVSTATVIDYDSEEGYNWRTYAPENIVELTFDQKMTTKNVTSLNLRQFDNAFTTISEAYISASYSNLVKTQPITFFPQSVAYSEDTDNYDLELDGIFMIGLWMIFENNIDMASTPIQLTLKFTNGTIHTATLPQYYLKLKKRTFICITRYDEMLEYRLNGEVFYFSYETSTLSLTNNNSYILISSQGDDITPSLNEMIILKNAIPAEYLLNSSYKSKEEYYQDYTPDAYQYTFNYLPDVIEENTLIPLKIY